MGFTLEFEELDAEIAPGVWLPTCMSGSCDIEIEDGEWYVESCDLDVCIARGVSGKYQRRHLEPLEIRLGSKYQRNPEIVAMIERALSRSSYMEDIQEHINASGSLHRSGCYRGIMA